MLAGGDSAEREVSLESGLCVTMALQQRGHDVARMDPAETPLTSERLLEFDVVLPLVHGTGGEDGSLQQRLQDLRVPYVGSSASASALTFDKVATRQVLQKAGIRIPAGFVVASQTDGPQIVAAASLLKYPVVVKPAAQGSSVGVSIVLADKDLLQAVRLARSFGPVVLIEQFIAGRELTVPVVDGLALPAVEIIPARSWYDYAAKYHDGRTQYVVHPLNVSAEPEKTAVRACEICQVSAISRVDFRVDDNGTAWVLEINTIPGMTSHSLVPMSAAACGLSLGELCEQACQRAILTFAGHTRRSA